MINCVRLADSFVYVALMSRSAKDSFRYIRITFFLGFARIGEVDILPF
jgi:hypothetical protein